MSTIGQISCIRRRAAFVAIVKFATSATPRLQKNNLDEVGIAQCMESPTSGPGTLVSICCLTWPVRPPKTLLSCSWNPCKTFRSAISCKFCIPPTRIEDQFEERTRIHQLQPSITAHSQTSHHQRSFRRALLPVRLLVEYFEAQGANYLLSSGTYQPDKGSLRRGILTRTGW